MVCRFILLFLCHFVLKSRGGLIEEPSVKVLFKDVYSNLGISSIYQEGTKSKIQRLDYWKFSKEANVKKIHNRLSGTRNTDSQNDYRLTKLIVDDLKALFALGRTQIDKAWEKHMSAFVSKADSIKPLAQKIHTQISSINDQFDLGLLELNSEALIRSLGPVRSRPETVAFAVEFHQLVLLWKASALYDDIALALAKLVYGRKIDTMILNENFHQQSLKDSLAQGSPCFSTRFFKICLKYQHNPTMDGTAFEKVLREVVADPWEIDIPRTQIFFKLVAQKAPYLLGSRSDIPRIASSATLLTNSQVRQWLDQVWENLMLDELEAVSRSFWGELPSDEATRIQTRSERIIELQAAKAVYQNIYKFHRAGRNFGAAFELYVLIGEGYAAGEHFSQQAGHLVASYMGEVERMTRTEPDLDALVPQHRATHKHLILTANLFAELLSPPYSSSMLEYCFERLLQDAKRKHMEHILASTLVELRIKISQTKSIKNILHNQNRQEISSSAKVAENAKKDFMEFQELSNKRGGFREAYEPPSVAGSDEATKKLEKIWRNIYQMNSKHAHTHQELRNHREAWEDLTQVVMKTCGSLNENTLAVIFSSLVRTSDITQKYRVLSWIYYTFTRVKSKEFMAALKEVQKHSQAVGSRQVAKLEKALTKISGNQNNHFSNWKNELFPILDKMTLDEISHWNDIFECQIKPILRTKLQTFLQEKPDLQAVLASLDSMEERREGSFYLNDPRTSEEKLDDLIGEEVMIFLKCLGKDYTIDKDVNKKLGQWIYQVLIGTQGRVL